MNTPHNARWWHGVPGILLGLALLLAAIAALLLVLHRIGIIGERTAQQPPAATNRAATADKAREAPASAGDAQSIIAGSGLGGQPKKVIFLWPREVTVGKENNVTYTLSTPTIEPRNAESVRLLLTVRLNNHQPYQANFWDASFRLLTEDGAIPASGGLNVVVDGRSTSAEERIVFNVPNRATVRALRITYLGESSEVPLRLQ